MTQPLLSPKLDLVFKQLFVKDKLLLLDILNQILIAYKFDPMTKITIRNPEILPEMIHKKFIILDVHVEDELGRGYDVEMQSKIFDCYPQRSLHYLTKLYSQQLDGGQKYNKMKAVFGVHFLGYKLFSEYDTGQHCFEWRERDHPTLRLTDQMALFIFELPKFKTVTSDPLSQWLHFFNHNHNSGEPSMYTHPPVQKAYKLLQDISTDIPTRNLADMRERALKNEVTLLDEAMEKGIAQGRTAGVVAGKKAGMIVGKKAGMVAGKKAGMVAGKKAGMVAGKKAGIAEGLQQGQLNIAQALLDVLDDKTIAQKTKLTITRIRKLRKEV
ncbi:MAG: Rpn family recombination-promoting nuclease/putative transposase [Thiomargarita sp.]|nr:Rpn family recombination-promoting nuclease/putative transposase [Thiomargarita sp.]